MRMIAIAGAALAAACSVIGGGGGGGGGGSLGDSHDEAIADPNHPAVLAFRVWQQALVAGDFDTFFALMTEEMHSQALRDDYRREMEGGILPRVEMLSNDEIAAIRAWYLHNRTAYRPTVLPRQVLESEWLRLVERDRFMMAADRLRNYYEGARIVQGWGTDVTVTLLVELRNRTIGSYEWVLVGDRWLWNVAAEPSPPERP